MTRFDLRPRVHRGPGANMYDDDRYTEADHEAAREDVRRGARGVTTGLFALFVVVGLAGGAVGAAFAGGDVVVTAFWCAVAAVIVGGPVVGLFGALMRRRGLDIGLEKARQGRLMEADARRREFDSRLSRALEMAGDEPAALDTIERAVRTAVADTAVELLLADNSQAHLARVLAVPDTHGAPGCQVGSPSECVAARRAQTQVFADSEELDACPRLRERAIGACSAVCVPVSIMGRTVGVLHTVGAPGDVLDDDKVAALQVLANHAGNRLGMLRIVAESQLQASTDGLTGLVNRRSFENRARALRSSGRAFSVVLADLDRFKLLNDTYGHEAGDRALRMFSEILRTEVREGDLVCRYGGEEFAVVLPGAETAEAIEAMQRVRAELRRVSQAGGMPPVTASFGIAHSDDAGDLDDLVQRADRALFAAKDAGRDCVCIDGHRGPVAANLTAIN
ncbi:MAG: sensor domain-containing diguanylate cyclase [Acidimicrobiia bacterium]